MMKKYAAWIWLGAGLLWIISNSVPPRHDGEQFDIATLGRAPVLESGREKPLDTVARTSLLMIHTKESLRLTTKDMPTLDKPRTMSAMEWLAEVMFNGPTADKLPVFVIHNPDVLGMFGWPQGERKYFSFEEVAPFLQKIDDQGRKAEAVESQLRSPFQSAVMNLRNALILYRTLRNSVQVEDTDRFADEIEAYVQLMPDALAEMMHQQKGEKVDKQKLEDFAKWIAHYKQAADLSHFLAVPPAAGSGSRQWASVGASMLATTPATGVNPVVKAYALIGDAYRTGDKALFNERARDLVAWMNEHEPHAADFSRYEAIFNQVAPFYQAMGLYVLAFLLVSFSWLRGSRSLHRSAVAVLLLALAVHTFGLFSRMYIQGRPPVTNLYSSAIFIGWGTVIIGLILERIYKDGIGLACSTVIGFVTLIIAHHLSSNGDTMEMMQAVLNSNMWLATHVVCITIGYSAMFFAGMLAIFYVLRGVFTSTMDKQASQSLSRMVYGVVCFATLFSFVGTVLGGIWADQSWGRFWGWDAKENGALMIVLWCAMMLHARWGGFIRARGLMVMALFGNVVTSFSWFGVNMLGVGLHSYGFMNKAFPWLVGFMASQFVLMALASMPLGKWKSFSPSPAPAGQPQVV